MVAFKGVDGDDGDERDSKHTCSDRTLAVTAITGTCPRTTPVRWSSRIVRTQVRPSMTGISQSMRIRERGLAEAEAADAQ